MALNIESDIEEPPENDKVVLDYSDDENPYTNYIKTETHQPSTSQGHKRRYNEYNDGQISFDEYLYKNCYTPRKGGGWNKIPHEYIPKYSTTSYNSPDILDLDCSTNPLRTLEDWKNRTGLLIQTNEDLKNLQPSEIFNFLIYKTTGAVYQYLSTMDIPAKTILYGDNAVKTFEKVLNTLTYEFIGRYPRADNANTTLSDQAIWHLTNLRICNMCYLESFICEFKIHYYQVIPERRKELDQLFFTKLPISVAQTVEAAFNNVVQKEEVPNTLGGRILTLQEWHKRACNEEKVKRQAKIDLCCEDFTKKIGKYGCENETRKIRKKRKYEKYKKWRKIPYKNYRKNRFTNPNKYFRNRKQYKQKINQKEYCPKGKTNCRCWLCNEEGHYANKCPKKNTNNKKQEILRLAYDCGFEPIESDFDLSDIELIEYISDMETSSNESEEDFN
ncbi:hypothetical protein LINPERHAP2_LOCUS37724 [Linum perenne]